MTGIVLEIASYPFALAFWVCLIGRRTWHVAKALYPELRFIMIWIVIPLWLVVDSAQHAWLNVVVDFLNLVVTVNTHDDDDRWNKRRKKLLAKVKAMGKLVVAPAPASNPA